MSVLPYLLLLVYRLLNGGDALQPEVIHGVVGGQVTFRCPSQPDIPLNYIYFNKDPPQGSHPQSFVSGYHQRMNMVVNPEYSKRTHVNDTQRAMTLTDIRPTDEGQYQCQIEYDNVDKEVTYMNLTVTAEYSKPVYPRVTEGCRSNCVATCSCYGGYPRHEVQWNSNLSLNRTWAVVLPGNWSQDPDTKLFNITGNLEFNCSSGLEDLSCTCGGVTSHQLSVCPPVSSHDMVTIVAVCIIMFLGIIGSCLSIRCLLPFCRRYRQGRL